MNIRSVFFIMVFLCGSATAYSQMSAHDYLGQTKRYIISEYDRCYIYLNDEDVIMFLCDNCCLWVFEFNEQGLVEHIDIEINITAPNAFNLVRDGLIERIGLVKVDSTERQWRYWDYVSLDGSFVYAIQPKNIFREKSSDKILFSVAKNPNRKW